jgi:hypothetical protein
MLLPAYPVLPASDFSTPSGMRLIFPLFYLESRFPRLFFYLLRPPRAPCPERIVEINPFLRIPLRELGYGIIF